MGNHRRSFKQALVSQYLTRRPERPRPYRVQTSRMGRNNRHSFQINQNLKAK